MNTTPRSRRSAFTLVEIMVATTIFGLISAGVIGVFIQSLSIYAYDTGKLLVNRDLRKFTGEMSENATYANYFRIFPSYANLSRTVDTLVNPSDPDQGFTTAITDTSLTDGNSGDCLVLVYNDPADDRKISRLIIYYRVPGTSTPTPAAGVQTFNRGAVRKVDLAITPSSSLPVFRLIPEISDPTAYPIVLPSVGVLSPTLVAAVPATNPVTYQPWGLFYNFYDRSIILKGELIETGSQLNQKNSTATNTYNFTVSPRG
jgi:prepilin-type N-terminal cleavage/methylation domain-containing protein